jgi:hypothetical protein
MIDVHNTAVGKRGTGPVCEYVSSKAHSRKPMP